MKNILQARWVVILMTIIPISAFANSFDIGIRINNNDPIQFKTTNIFKAFDYLNQKNIDAQFSAYSGVEPLSVNIQYEDVRIQYAYPDENSSKLVVNIPAIGFRKTFVGVDRNDSKNMARDALRDGGYLKKLQRAFVREGTQKTEENAVAGNSFSLLNQMVRNDFDQAIMGRQMVDNSAGSLIAGHFLWGATYQDNQHIRMMGLSPAYHLKLSPDARFSLHLNSPLVQTTYGAQESYQALPNLTLLTLINQSWQLGLGATIGWLYTPNSEKTVQFRGMNISNQLQMDWGNSTVKLANMVSHYGSEPINGYDPDLQHTVVKTSVFVEQSISLLDIPLKTRLGGATTQFYGDELAQKNIEEVSLQLITQTRNPVFTNFRTEFGSTTTFLFSLGIGL